jgi:hypothetical protein
MKCPNCGAENEAGARFCVECGAPLEDQVDTPPHPPEFDEDDSDRTILSSFSRVAEEAKTVAVTQDQLAAAEAEAMSARPSSTPPPTGGASSSSSGSGGGFWTQRNIIIIVVVVIVLLALCCCCSLLIGGALGNPELLEDLSLRLLPAYLPYI